MHIYTRNINTGFADALRLFVTGEHAGYRPDMPEHDSRYGPTKQVNEPVTFTFSSPGERCLFHPLRDVNPFSVLYESLWVLAGRNDVAPLAYYTPRMVEFSDDGETWYGAYGRRWTYPTDQISEAVRILKESNGTRRVVLSMWDAALDLKGQRLSGKDYPCNTHMYVKIRGGKLQITVCNRSNDTVWGLFGTNYVVFAFLQEYLAGKVGVAVGPYHHMSDDLHVYTERHGEKIKDWLEWYGSGRFPTSRPVDRYDPPHLNTSVEETDPEPRRETGVHVPILSPGEDAAVFDAEVKEFVDCNHGAIVGDQVWQSKFLSAAARPMCRAFFEYKSGRKEEALNWANRVEATDWRFASTEWLKRRKW